MVSIAKCFAETLKELGIKYVFGVPSGNWVDYMEAIRQVDGLEFVLVSNEASGGFMADVCWRLTGQIAACFGTFGPGACNLSTGVCGGYLDRSPMLVFTDEMNENMRYRTSQMNIDHQKLFEPITKWTTRINSKNVQETLHKGMQIACSEVPGPVHIGLPAGIGLHYSTNEKFSKQIVVKIPPANNSKLQNMAGIFKNSQKPLIALGITSIRANVQELVLKILEKYNIPAVLTPMAKGMIPEDHPSYVGVLSHALSNVVAQTYQQADLVIGIGYDTVELNYEDWIPNVPLIHIDTTSADIDTENFTLACDVIGNLKQSLEYLLTIKCDAKDWDLNELLKRKEKMFASLTAPKNSFGPRKVLEKLRTVFPKNSIMTCDVGAHLHLIGQQWKTFTPECQLMTNGCSSMGFAIPAAIAAKLTCPEREVCCVVGDGGFAMMAGEMITAKRLNLNIVFVVLNDAELALIRIKQERKGFQKYGTIIQTEKSKNEKSNYMFGVQVLPATNPEQFEHALSKAFNTNGPVIIETFIDSREYDELVLRGNM